MKARFESNKRKLEEKKREYELDTRLREAAEEEARVKELRRERRRDKKRKLQVNLAKYLRACDVPGLNSKYPFL